MDKANCNCKVGKSPHRIEYEKLRFVEDYSFRDLETHAQEEYNEKISYTTFRNHFNKHFKPMKNKRIHDSEEGKKLVDKKIGETLDVIEELKSNVKILKQILSSSLETEEELNYQKINSIRSCLSEARKTLTSLSELTQNLKIKSTNEESEKDEFLGAVKRLPPDLAEKVLRVLEGEEIE